MTLSVDILATSSSAFDASFSRKDKSLETDVERRENACVALGLNLAMLGFKCSLTELRKYSVE